MATTKKKLLVLEIKANGHYLRQVAVTYYGSTSVVKNLKFLTPFFSLQELSFINYHCNLLE